jgi:hypothetical protein
MATGATSQPKTESLYLRILEAPIGGMAERWRWAPYVLVRRCYARWRGSPIPAEYYQLGWLAVLLALFFTTPHQGVWSWIAAGLACLRAADLLAYALYTILFGRVIASPERSLLLLIGNMVEVVLGSAVILLDRGCVEGADRCLAFYSGLRTLVTIGPAIPEKEAICRLVIGGQITIDYVLTLIALVLVLGSLGLRVKSRS